MKKLKSIVEFIKKYMKIIMIAVRVAKELAKLTPNQIDDKIVGFIEKALVKLKK